MKKPVKTSVISVIVFTAALFVIYSCLNLSHRNITDNISENWLGVSDDTQDVSEYYIDHCTFPTEIRPNRLCFICQTRKSAAKFISRRI